MSRLLLLALFLYSLTARSASGFVTPPPTAAGRRIIAKTRRRYRDGATGEVERAALDSLLGANKDTTSRVEGIEDRIKRRLRVRRRSAGHEAHSITGLYSGGTVTRLYSGDDGQSHLQPIAPRMDEFVDDEGAFGRATPWLSCDRMTIRLTPRGYSHSWHNAPRRQYVVQLQGSLEVEVASGDTAVIWPGDVLLAEDMTGQGHKTRQKGDGPCMYAVVVVADEDVQD